jgi:hypothetical protein
MGSKVGPRGTPFRAAWACNFFDQRIGLAASCPDITSWAFDNTQLILVSLEGAAQEHFQTPDDANRAIVIEGPWLLTLLVSILALRLPISLCNTIARYRIS